MARKQRIHYEGAIYHVIARGNNRENIFKEAEDKARYLQLLDRYKQKYDCEIYAYVIMDNHIHLLITIVNTPLAKIMQGLQQTYTQYFNRKYNHIGHVFQQRYKAFPCTDDKYLASLLCYIHQNPVRANIREGITYPWSSHKAYIIGHDWLVNVDFILECLSDKRKQAICKYLEMVSKEQNEPNCINEEVSNAIQLVGEKEIVINQIASNKKEEITEHITWEQLVEKIILEEGVCAEELLGSCRIRRVVTARNRLIYEAVNANVMTRTELARKLHLDPARITKGYQQVEQRRKGKQ